MPFYFLRQDLFDNATGIEIKGHTEVTSGFNWVDGVKFDRACPHETLVLNDAYGSNYPDYFDTSVPVMSMRLIGALGQCGIANLDTYPVDLRNPSDGQVRTDYRAVNLIGQIEAVDLASSPHEMWLGIPIFSGPIVIDEAKVAGLLAFRLPYSPRFIVVAESVALRIQQMGLDSVLLQPTTSYRGV